MSEETKNFKPVVREKLLAFMRAFDSENRNNRLSAALIEGMGGLLENLIINIVDEINQKPDESGDRTPLHDKYDKLMEERQEQVGDPRDPN